jgi:serine/threonine protein phosphatase PrpC
MTAPFSTPFRVALWALSDTGCVRENNEDCFGFDESLGIYVVCDGMGGLDSGEVASSRAVAAILTNFRSTAQTDATVGSRLLMAIYTANRDVFEAGRVPPPKGMGTTAVAATVDANQLLIANVGDSRAYLVDSGICQQITVDHSYINELIRNGTLTAETARSSDVEAMQSIITRAIGIASEVEPDIYTVDLHPGAAVLLTTDGLTRHVQADEIAAVFAAFEPSLVCARLIQLAKERGGHDNITCMLLVCLSA